jgi:polar amino acid transport system substrate-binding protein
MASRTTVAARSVATAILALVTGCTSPDANAPNMYATPSVPVCDKATLATRAPGRWTVGTGKRVTAPWFLADRPQSGQGFESAVAYAVAERLGFTAADVTWTRVDAEEALAAGPKPFDVAIDRFVQTPARKKHVDMSTWYYLDRQAVVALRTSGFADAGSLAELRGARLGAAAGSTGLLAATDLVRPTHAPTTFDEVDDARRALFRHQLDGVVVDLPAAFALVRERPGDLVLVGQLPRTGVPAQFGLVLAKSSPLTVCVRKAVDELRADGSLLVLEKQWLVRTAGVPELS